MASRKRKRYLRGLGEGLAAVGATLLQNQIESRRAEAMARLQAQYRSEDREFQRAENAQERTARAADREADREARTADRKADREARQGLLQTEIEARAKEGDAARAARLKEAALRGERDNTKYDQITEPIYEETVDPVSGEKKRTKVGERVIGRWNSKTGVPEYFAADDFDQVMGPGPSVPPAAALRTAPPGAARAAPVAPAAAPRGLLMSPEKRALMTDLQNMGLGAPVAPQGTGRPAWWNANAPRPNKNRPEDFEYFK